MKNIKPNSGSIQIIMFGEKERSLNVTSRVLIMTSTVLIPHVSTARANLEQLHWEMNSKDFTQWRGALHIDRLH